jgi:phage shock protein C
MASQKSQKKLYKSKDNRVISGVFGGLGDYFDVDPTVLRLTYLVFVILTGFFPGLVAYVIAVLIVPQRS